MGSALWSKRVSKTSFCDGMQGGPEDRGSRGIFSGKLEVETIFLGKRSESLETGKSWDNEQRFL